MDEVRDHVRKEDELAISDVLGSANGRRFLLIVLSAAHWGEDVFAVEPTAMAFNVGKQSVANEIYRRLTELQPELVAKAFSEERSRQDWIAERMERERAGERD